jgi:hypothetical protein
MLSLWDLIALAWPGDLLPVTLSIQTSYAPGLLPFLMPWFSLFTSLLSKGCLLQFFHLFWQALYDKDISYSRLAATRVFSLYDYAPAINWGFPATSVPQRVLPVCPVTADSFWPGKAVSRSAIQWIKLSSPMRSEYLVLQESSSFQLCPFLDMLSWYHVMFSFILWLFFYHTLITLY